MIYIIPTDTCFGMACRIDDIESYQHIYALKNRSLEKPLALMVEDFEYLKRNTTLSDNQINFLKNYKRPFTVLADTKKDFISSKIPNKFKYKKTAFRVVHMPEQKKLIKEIGPIFLTSANISSEKEIYSLENLPFETNEKVTILATQDLEINPPSDIFEFRGSSTECIYIRKF